MFLLEFSSRTPNEGISSSDRLKKAIERNRAKVARKQGILPNSSRNTVATVRASSAQSSAALSERLANLKKKRLARSSGSVNGTGKLNARNVFSSGEPVGQGRTNPTTASKIEILKARRQNISNQPVNASAKKGFGEKIVEKNFSFFEKFFSAAFKATIAKTIRVAVWCGCFFFLAAVIFGDRGVLDYASRHTNLIEKNNQLRFLMNENEEIKFQIYRLENDRSYQRQVIRDYLGYIARDEYLVIFAEN